MGNPSLLLDLPIELMMKIWLPITIADPRAVLRLETASKQVQHRLQGITLLARCMILNEQRFSNFQTCARVMLEANQRMADGGFMTRPEYLTLCRALDASQLAAERLTGIYQQLLERDTPLLTAAYQSRVKKAFVGCEQTQASGYEACRQVLHDLRAQVIERQCRIGPLVARLKAGTQAIAQLFSQPGSRSLLM